MGPGIAAHVFVTDGLAPPNADAIYLGQEAISAATDQTGWRTPVLVPSAAYQLFDSAHASGASWWTLFIAPPRIHASARSGVGVKPTAAVPEWGEPLSLDTDELFDTRALDDFHSADLSKLTIPFRYNRLSRERKSGGNERDRSLFSSSPKRKKARRGFLSDTDDPGSSRRTLSRSISRKSTPPIILVPSTLSPRQSPSPSGVVSETLSIHSIIPLPHYLMSPAPRTPQPEPAEAVSVPDHPIHLNLMYSLGMPPLPSLSSSITSRPWNSVYSRGAWIVPLVGPALHSSGTPASTLASPDLLPPPLDIPSAAVNPNTSTASASATVPPATRPLIEQIRILWTPESLPQFWSLLIRIRKKAVLGPIGFSLEHEDLVNLIKHEHSPQPRGPGPISSSDGSVSTHPSGGRDGAGKQMQRHQWIKLYCESRYALRLRTVLENFRAVESFEGPPSSARVKGHSYAGHGVYKPENPVATGDSNVDKRSRKILLGTRLVFVDDLGRPAIVS